MKTPALCGGSSSGASELRGDRDPQRGLRELPPLARRVGARARSPARPEPHVRRGARRARESTRRSDLSSSSKGSATATAISTGAPPASRARSSALSVGSGGTVGIFLPNLPAFLEIVFGSQRVGSCAVPINTALKDEGLRYVLDHARVDVLFTTASLLPAYEQVGPRLRKQPVLVVVPEHEVRAAIGARAFPMTSCCARRRRRRPMPRSRPSCPSFLMYTSGTTGHPKGVVYGYGHSQAKLARLSAHLLLARRRRLLHVSSAVPRERADGHRVPQPLRRRPGRRSRAASAPAASGARCGRRARRSSTRSAP